MCALTRRTFLVFIFCDSRRAEGSFLDLWIYFDLCVLFCLLLFYFFVDDSAAVDIFKRSGSFFSLGFFTPTDHHVVTAQAPPTSDPLTFKINTLGSCPLRPRLSFF